MKKVNHLNFFRTCFEVSTKMYGSRDMHGSRDAMSEGGSGMRIACCMFTYTGKKRSDATETNQNLHTRDGAQLLTGCTWQPPGQFVRIASPPHHHQHTCTLHLHILNCATIHFQCAQCKPVWASFSSRRQTAACMSRPSSAAAQPSATVSCAWVIWSLGLMIARCELCILV